MATQSSQQTNVSQLSIKRLISPISRCILLVLMLSTSTGLLIRQLIGVTLRDLLALSVGVLWFLGDLLPTISLLFLLHNLLISENRDGAKRIFPFDKQTVSSLDCIIVLFSSLYLLDLVISISCYLGSFRHQSDTCQNLQKHYRYAFFHVQIFVAILYLTQPWRWSRLDLRRILADTQKFIYLLSATIQSLMQRINSRQPDRVKNQLKNDLPVLDSTEISAENENVRSDAAVDDQIGKQSMKSEVSTPSSSKLRAVKSRTRRARTSSSARVKKAKLSKGAVLVVNQSAKSRSTMSRQKLGRRKAPQSSRSTASQIVISSDDRRRRRSCGGSKSSLSEDHLCNFQPDSTRTVNLNLNVS